MVDAVPLILVVEDEPMLALDLQDLLEEGGYHTAVAATAAAVEAVLLLGVPPAAAVVDLRLRDGMTGPLIAQRLHEIGVPVIIHSGERSDMVGTLPAVAWLVKPARHEDILAAVRGAIGDDC